MAHRLKLKLELAIEQSYQRSQLLSSRSASSQTSNGCSSARSSGSDISSTFDDLGCAMNLGSQSPRNLSSSSDGYKQGNFLSSPRKHEQRQHPLRLAFWVQLHYAATSMEQFSLPLRRKRAVEKLQDLLGPIIRLQKHRQRRLALLVQCLRSFVGVPTLSGSPPFASWPQSILAPLLHNLRPIAFSAGEYVMYEGEPITAVYVIHAGCVDVMVKGRTVGSLTSGDSFGCESLMGYAHSNVSLKCSSEHVLCWIMPKDFVKLQISLASVDDQQYSTMFEPLIQERLNLMERTVTKAEKMASLKRLGFQDEVALHSLIPRLHPQSKPAGAIIFHEGSDPISMYFVSHGAVQLWKKTIWWQSIVENDLAPSGTVNGRSWDRELGELISVVCIGEVFGEVGCILLEQQPYTAMCTAGADLWSLPGIVWHNACIPYPEVLDNAKSAAKQKKLTWFSALPVEWVLRSRVLQVEFGDKLGTFAEMFRDLSQPMVLSAKEEMELHGILFLIQGSLSTSLTGVCKGPKTLGNITSSLIVQALTPCEIWFLPSDMVHESYAKYKDLLSHKSRTPLTCQKRMKQLCGSLKIVVSDETTDDSTLGRSLTTYETSTCLAPRSPLTPRITSPGSPTLPHSPTIDLEGLTAQGAVVNLRRRTKKVRKASSNPCSPLLTVEESDAAGCLKVANVASSPVLQLHVKTPRAVKFARGFMPPGFSSLFVPTNFHPPSPHLRRGKSPTNQPNRRSPCSSSRQSSPAPPVSRERSP